MEDKPFLKKRSEEIIAPYEEDLIKDENTEGSENKANVLFNNLIIPEYNATRKKTETSYDYDGLENYNSAINDIEEELGMNQKSKEIINNLKKKIDDLESQVFSLKKKNENLKKNNVENKSKMKRISFVGTRHKFTFGLSGKNCRMDKLDKMDVAEFMKEKNDLQEINEKMLNILTEKEIENEELQDNFKLYKKNIKKEIQNYLDIIKDLKEKNEKNSKNKGNLDKNLEDLMEEYNSYKERMEKSLNEYVKKEEELNKELSEKEKSIQKLKSDIQNLGAGNPIQEKEVKEEKEEKKEKDKDDELNLDKLISENKELKKQLEEKNKEIEEKDKIILNQKNEIKKLNQDIENDKENIIKIKEEKIREINNLNNDITKNNKEIEELTKENEELQEENEELNKKNGELDSKLEKKSKELQDISESAKKLLENKESQIKEFDKKIEEINKDKKLLIDQNHELLDKVKKMKEIKEKKQSKEKKNEKEDNQYITNGFNDGNDDIDENEEIILENQLLTTEIKSLKEQLESQAINLVTFSAMEKEVSRLKTENEQLVGDYNNLKYKMNKQQYNVENDNLLNTIKKHSNLLRRVSILNNIPIDENDVSLAKKGKSEKELENLKTTKKKENETFPNEIDKLKEEIVNLKVKYLNHYLESETIISRYKNIIKAIEQECSKKGFKFNLNNINSK